LFAKLSAASVGIGSGACGPRRRSERQAQGGLAAATARIGASIADLFPAVAVTAGVGAQGGRVLQNSTTAPIHRPIWSIGPSSYLPFLDFGRLDALIDAQELQTHELLVNYKKTILVAVAEVDAAIKGISGGATNVKGRGGRACGTSPCGRSRHRTL
jgi:outer membrane protein TolC